MFTLLPLQHEYHAFTHLLSTKQSCDAVGTYCFVCCSGVATGPVLTDLYNHAESPSDSPNKHQNDLHLKIHVCMHVHPYRQEKSISLHLLQLKVTSVCDTGSAGSYVSGSPIVVDGAQWLYKKPGVPMDVVLKASRGECKHSRPGSQCYSLICLTASFLVAH